MDSCSFSSSDAYYKNKGEIRVKDLESCPDPIRTIVNELVDIHLRNGGSLDKKALQAFRKEDDTNQIRNQLLITLKSYTPPLFSRAELNQDNRQWEEDYRSRSEHERAEKRKINDEVVTLPDGTSTGYSYRNARRIKLRFEGTVPRDSFKNLTQYYTDMEGKRTTLTIPTLLEYLKKASDMGLSKDSLPEALKMFAENCLPRIAGSLSLRGEDLPKTIAKIVNAINPRREKLLLEQKLKQIKRNPSDPILGFVEPLLELFEAYGKVDRVQSLSMEDQDKEDKRNFSYLRVALRALLSENAQRAVVRALKDLNTDPSREQYESILAETDYKSPLTSGVTLPGSLTMLEGSSIETELFAVLDSDSTDTDFMAPGLGFGNPTGRSNRDRRNQGRYRSPIRRDISWERRRNSRSPTRERSYSVSPHHSNQYGRSRRFSPSPRRHRNFDRGIQRTPSPYLSRRQSSPGFFSFEQNGYSNSNRRRNQSPRRYRTSSPFPDSQRTRSPSGRYDYSPNRSPSPYHRRAQSDRNGSGGKYRDRGRRQDRRFTPYEKNFNPSRSRSGEKSPYPEQQNPQHLTSQGRPAGGEW